MEKLINLRKFSRQLGYNTNRVRRVLRWEKYRNKIELVKINKIFFLKVEDLNKLVKITEEARMICRAVIKKIINVLKIKALDLTSKSEQEAMNFIKEVVEAFEDSVIGNFNYWINAETYAKNRETFRHRLMLKLSRNLT